MFASMFVVQRYMSASSCFYIRKQRDLVHRANRTSRENKGDRSDISQKYFSSGKLNHREFMLRIGTRQRRWRVCEALETSVSSTRQQCHTGVHECEQRPTPHSEVLSVSSKTYASLNPRLTLTTFNL
jgi:hypothetical protein